MFYAIYQWTYRYDTVAAASWTPISQITTSTRLDSNPGGNSAVVSNFDILLTLIMSVTGPSTIVSTTDPTIFYNDLWTAMNDGMTTIFQNQNVSVTTIQQANAARGGAPNSVLSMILPNLTTNQTTFANAVSDAIIAFSYRYAGGYPESSGPNRQLIEVPTFWATLGAFFNMNNLSESALAKATTSLINNTIPYPDISVYVPNINTYVSSTINTLEEFVSNIVTPLYTGSNPLLTTRLQIKMASLAVSNIFFGIYEWAYRNDYFFGATANMPGFSGITPTTTAGANLGQDYMTTQWLNMALQLILIMTDASVLPYTSYKAMGDGILSFSNQTMSISGIANAKKHSRRHAI